jgi:hypothetical protein
VIITSNHRIFKDPMTTAAAIDRLVHHAVILEMTGPSIRADEAEQARKESTTTKNLKSVGASNRISRNAHKTRVL